MKKLLTLTLALMLVAQAAAAAPLVERLEPGAGGNG